MILNYFFNYSNRLMDNLPIVVVLLFCHLSLSTYSQALDSTKTQRLKDITDTISALAKNQFNADSLKILCWSDTLKSDIRKRFVLDSLSCQAQLDSLKNMHLSCDSFIQTLDSLKQKEGQLLREVESKKAQLLSKTNDKLEAWEDEARRKIEAFKLKAKVPGDVSKNHPRGSPSIAGLSSANEVVAAINSSAPNNVELILDLPELPSLSVSDFRDAGLSPDLSAFHEAIPTDAVTKIQEWQTYLRNADHKLSTVKEWSSNPDGMIEEALENVKELQALHDQFISAEEMKNNELVKTAEKLKDPDALKQALLEAIVKKTVNHFIGKDDVLQQAMDKMARYKLKYESINSLSEIKERPVNKMHGRPFIERLLPGIAMQVLNKGDLFVDVNPYVAYQITAGLCFGTGWNQRIGYSPEHHYFTSASVIYGPRTFAEHRVWRGFSVRAEGELANTPLPATLHSHTVDTHEREWIKTVFVGLKKEYPFLKDIKGTAFIMFAVYRDHLRSAYGDAVNSRFGFEFLLRKARRTAN